MKFIARTPIKTHKGDEKWPLFVNKQLFWWSTSITMHNNNEVLVDFKPFFTPNTLPHTSVGLTGCISIVFSVLNIFGSFDHCAAGYVPLTITAIHIIYIHVHYAVHMIKKKCMQYSEAYNCNQCIRRNIAGCEIRIFFTGPDGNLSE